MDKEIILEKSRKEKMDEGEENILDKSRKMAFSICSCMYIVVVAVTVTFSRERIGLLIPAAMICTFSAAEYRARYNFYKKKSDFVKYVLMQGSALCWFVAYMVLVIFLG